MELDLYREPSTEEGTPGRMSSDVRFSHLSTGEAFLMENAPNSGFTAGSLYLKLFNLNAACAIRIEDGHTVKLMADPVVVRVNITSVTVEQR